MLPDLQFVLGSLFGFVIAAIALRNFKVEIFHTHEHFYEDGSCQPDSSDDADFWKNEDTEPPPYAN